MNKSHRLIYRCSCGKIVDSVRVPPGQGGEIVQSFICWKCRSRFVYDVTTSHNNKPENIKEKQTYGTS